MTKQTIYTVGGTVQAGGGIYIKRTADDELLELCRAGELGFILSSRQVGKSSLMIRTAEQLEKEDIRSGIVDLSSIGVQVTQDEWYLGILNEITLSLDLETDIFAWWTGYARLGPAQRFFNFLRDVLLNEIMGKIVLFFDEIDSTLSIPFADDFFASLRAAYNARSTVPNFKRLSFVLVGVATPSDLISDSKRTPFNIGRRVDLNDFTLKEALPFARGLGENAEQVLAWIFEWSGGHPYLTQRLCAELSRSNGAIDKQTVTQVAEALFIGEQGQQDNNLQFVRDMLVKRSPDVRGVMLTYRDIRLGKKVTDEERSIVKAHLKISGVVNRQAGKLVTRNRIYERAFDPKWIKENTPSAVPRRIMIGSSLAVVIALFISAYFAYVEWTLTDAERAALLIEDYRSSDAGAQVRLRSLAGLYALGNGYVLQAYSLFNNLTTDEKIELFSSAGSSRVQRNQIIVAKEIYPFLHDTEDGNAVLASISGRLLDSDPDLSDEIDAWLAGRAAMSEGELDEAEQMLSAAIRKASSPNPGIYYDRARAYIGIGSVYYPNALKDLQEVVLLSPGYSSAIRRLIQNDEVMLQYWETYQDDYLALAKAMAFSEVYIPAGEFPMGSEGGKPDEEPVHDVYLDAFYIDTYEATNAMYIECVFDNVCSLPTRFDSFQRDSYFGNLEYSDFPVLHVSWEDAKTYCSWRGARLPTEAEWEKAARGTDRRTYPWGEELDQTYANYHDIIDTTPVGSYEKGKSPYGAYDMAGNAWEWVADWYGENYYAISPSSNPLGPKTGEFRVLRSGSWAFGDYEYLGSVRSADRYYDHPSNTRYSHGFRCARSE